MWLYDSLSRMMDWSIIIALAVFGLLFVLKVTQPETTVTPDQIRPADVVSIRPSNAVTCNAYKQAYIYLRYCAPPELDDQGVDVYCYGDPPAGATFTEPQDYATARFLRDRYKSLLSKHECGLAIPGQAIRISPGASQGVAPATETLDDETVESFRDMLMGEGQ